MERFATTNPQAWLLIAPFWEKVVTKAKLKDGDVLHCLWKVFEGREPYRLVIFHEGQRTMGFAILSYDGWKTKIEFLGMHPDLSMEERKELEKQLWEECTDLSDVVVFSSKRPQKLWERRINIQPVEGVYQWHGNESQN